MRHWLAMNLVASVILLVVSAPTSAAELSDGIEAYCAKDLAEAFRILEPLAEQGNSDAQLIMGFRFFHGMDGKQDPQRARKWYRKAAEQGDAEAQVELGLMLAQGQGGKGDIAEAVGWFRKAAEAGYAAGQYNLGYAYCTGQDIPVDAVECMRWYTKAAEQGDTWAQSNLGHLHASGGWTGASKVLAYKWLMLASENGDEAAKKLLEGQRPLMTADELREAEHLAEQFEPKSTAATKFITRRCRSDKPDASGETQH